jgi:hypothetical protein
MRNLLANLNDLAHAAAAELLTHLPGARPLSDTADPAAAPTCPIGRNAHPAHDGMLICRGHFTELGRLLRQIEDDTAILSTAPSYAISYESKGSKGLASEEAPARLNVIAFTDPRTNLVPKTPRPDRPARQAKRFGPWCLMCHHETCVDWRAGRDRDQHDDEQDAGSDRIISAEATLHAWADNVRDDRRLAHPDTTTLSGERDLLTRQLRWIADQYWVVDFYAELKRVAGELASANGTADVPVGTCGSLRPDGQLCEGDVWHILLRPDGSVVQADELPYADAQPGFRCGSCRRVWTGTDAVRKRHDMWLTEQTRKTEKGKITS